MIRIFSLFAGLSLSALVAALPATNLTSRQLPGVLPGSVPTEDFRNDNGFKAAEAAAPVWLFSRVDGRTTCYPESAIVLGSDPPAPNPGTDVPLGLDPGEDCNDPGPYTGRLSPGNPFPNYIDTQYCEGTDTWRVVYHVYYVHDGSSSVGHKHDFESVTVQWKRDAPGLEWWHRDAFIMSNHQAFLMRGWGDVQTINNNGDLTETRVGLYNQHPKAYVGFHKHPGFFEEKKILKVNFGSEQEWRSDDWYFIPAITDFKPLTDIDANWVYGTRTGADKGPALDGPSYHGSPIPVFNAPTTTNPRSYSHERICKWSLDDSKS